MPDVESSKEVTDDDINVFKVEFSITASRLTLSYFVPTGRAARELIASSSNEIVKEVGPPIVKAIIAKIIDNVENFFQHVPASELAEE